MSLRIKEEADRSASRVVDFCHSPVHPHGCNAKNLLTYNERWASVIREKDPEYFERLAKGQNPDFFFLGCCDSRVVPSEMLGLLQGEVFVHRSVAALISPKDSSVMAAAQYAVNHLHVKTVIVTGHHRCGGIAAGYEGKALGVGDAYMEEIHRLRALYKKRIEEEIPGEGATTARLDAFAEISVLCQCKNLVESPVMQKCWEAEKKHAGGEAPTSGKEGNAAGGVQVLGWVFELASGTLREMISLHAYSSVESEVEKAIENVFHRYHQKK